MEILKRGKRCPIAPWPRRNGLTLIYSISSYAARRDYTQATTPCLCRQIIKAIEVSEVSCGLNSF
jgi:hypothetical protein